MKIKKILGGIFFAALFAFLNSSQAQAQVSFAGGDGTEGSPYQIATCAQLQNINDDLGSYYVLKNDVDCSETATLNPDGNGGYYGFEPIGDFSNRFFGKMDGQEHKISDVYINRTGPEGMNVGLFSVIDEGGEVKNLGLENADISGNQEVGALAGGLSGRVENVSSSGFVNGNYTVGGLVGQHVPAANMDNSSPLVYTWNGEKYIYVADVGNMIPRENNGFDLAQIDSQNLVPKNNKYSMRISQEYNEIVYFDELSLMTFDHQPGYTVVSPLDVDTKVEDLMTISDTPTNPLLGCQDKYGNDCLDSLKDYDDKWSFKDASFVNSWVLDFGNLANKDSIHLIMRGARDYAAGTSGNFEKMRDIEVKDADGNWVTVYDKSTLSSDGTPRLRTIDLTGKFLSDNYQVRVTFGTQNVNYFAVDTSPQVPFTTNIYHPTKADLQFRGFTAIDKTYYYDHDYDSVSPAPEGMFKNQFGNFTKYGEVSPLLQSTNDQFVVMRYGDQMDIEFPYVAPAEGQERSFILNNEAMYKHATNDKVGDLGQTVSPLPYQGMEKYSVDTAYPMTQENQTYLNEWNTRSYAGKLTSSGSTIVNSFSSADVSGSSILGGLVGQNQKLITGSYATGNVSGSHHVGGLVGNAYGTDSIIENCYATGDVSGVNNSIGGFVGGNGEGSISNSYATGDVTAGDNNGYIGGFIGSDYNSSGTPQISNSFSTGDVNGGSLYIGGFVGYYGGNVDPDYAGNNNFWNNNLSTGVGLVNGYNESSWPTQAENKTYFQNNSTNEPLASWSFSGDSPIWEVKENSYPTLKWQSANASQPINPGATSEKFLEDIQAGFISIDGSDPQITNSVIFNEDYTITLGDATIILPAGTEMTKTGGGSIDFTQMTIQDITNALSQATTSNIAGAIQIGIPGLKLTFSTPITISIPVDPALNGQTLNVYFQNEGEENWNQQTVCLVAAGLCSFLTDHATKLFFGLTEHLKNGTLKYA